MNSSTLYALSHITRNFSQIMCTLTYNSTDMTESTKLQLQWKSKDMRNDTKPFTHGSLASFNFLNGQQKISLENQYHSSCSPPVQK